MTSTTDPAAGPARLGRRLAFLNNKGGVGKTAKVREVGAALARRGRRVLWVDMDPQANLTRRAVVKEFTEAGSLTDVLKAPVEKGGAAAAIVPCGWDAPEAKLLDILPADIDLEERTRENAEPGFHNRLRRALYGVTDNYDYTLFDCRPSLGALEEMVVAALDDPDGKDGVYIVVEPGRDAISGAARVIETVDAWADLLEVRATVLGVVVNQARANTNLHSARIEHMPKSLDRGPGLPAPPVLEPHIPLAIRIAAVQDRAIPASTDRELTAKGIVALYDELAAVIDKAAA